MPAPLLFRLVPSPRYLPNTSFNFMRSAVRDMQFIGHSGLSLKDVVDDLKLL